VQRFRSFRTGLDRFWNSLAWIFVSLESPFRDHDEVGLISAARACLSQQNRVGRQRRAEPSLDITYIRAHPQGEPTAFNIQGTCKVRDETISSASQVRDKNVIHKFITSRLMSGWLAPKL